MKKIKLEMFPIFCLMFLAMSVHAQTVQSGFTVEREIFGTEKHIYEVSLTKGQIINFVAHQRGADIVLQAFTADGKFYDRVDSPNGDDGDEAIKFVSLNGGNYRFEIKSYSPNFEKGKYFIKPLELRKATNSEIKAQKLKDDLMKIVALDNRSDTTVESLKRIYLDRGFLIGQSGFIWSTADFFASLAQSPPNLPADSTSEDQFSEARMEDFGDTVLLSVRRSRHNKNPQQNVDITTVQRIGYVFKRVKSEWRIAAFQFTFIEREFKPVKLDGAKLDAFIGVYEGEIPALTLTVLREGDVLYFKFPEGEKIELTPESENIFYADSTVGINIAFVRNANGAVTQAVVSYSSPQNRLMIQPKIK